MKHYIDHNLHPEEIGEIGCERCYTGRMQILEEVPHTTPRRKFIKCQECKHKASLIVEV